MTRSQLIEVLAQKQPHLAAQDVELAVNFILEHLSETLASGERIEIRAFGSFTLRSLPARAGRNPATGEPVAIPGRRAIHFKPGAELRERADSSNNRMAE